MDSLLFDPPSVARNDYSRHDSMSSLLTGQSSYAPLFCAHTDDSGVTNASLGIGIGIVEAVYVIEDVTRVA
jgi:hypothetical protein